MRTKEQIDEIIALLEDEYPLADCTLDFRKDYELLFSVRLAAQCTDERVNKVTPAFFAAYPTLESIAAAEPEDIEPYIRSCGFFRSKARDIVLASRVLLAEYGGKVPDNMLPPDKSTDFCHRMVHHGRAVCDARKPACERCCIKHLCRTFTGQ